MRIRRTVSSVLSAIMLVATLHGSVASGLSRDQLRALNGGPYYYNTLKSNDSGGCTASVGPGTLPSLVPEPYNGDFTAAGKAYNVSPVLLASLFTEENFTGDSTDHLAARWKALPSIRPDPNSGWPTSPDNAMGPFQFIPSTWTNLGVDADKNGKADVENLLDASYGAANYAKTDGATADAPKSKWVSFANGYSGETGGYASQVAQYIDFYASGGTATNPTSTDTSVTSNCGGAVAGSIVQTALNFAWDDFGQPGGHDFNSKGEAEAKTAYVVAVKKYETDAGSDPAGFTTDYTDCGAFVATVMRASGVDPTYQELSTGTQLTYVQSHPDKYTVYKPGEWGTSGAVTPQAGDIFISDGHTYIYVGKHTDNDITVAGKHPDSTYTVAQASQGDHVPEVNAQPYTQQTINGHTELFYLARHK